MSTVDWSVLENLPTDKDDFTVAHYNAKAALGLAIVDDARGNVEPLNDTETAEHAMNIILACRFKDKNSKVMSECLQEAKEITKKITSSQKHPYYKSGGFDSIRRTISETAAHNYYCATGQSHLANLVHHAVKKLNEYNVPYLINIRDHEYASGWQALEEIAKTLDEQG